MQNTTPLAARSETDLRKRVSAFLRSRARGRKELLGALDAIAETSEMPLLFGGLLRDLAIFPGTVIPRDIDVVVQSSDLEFLTRRIEPMIRRRTRFGGVQIVLSGWKIDVWPLAETWAFRSGIVEPATPGSLPRTTFLNVEAVAIDLYASRGQRHTYTDGFFEAIESRVLDINLEANPFPELCVIRSLVTAARLKFALSPRLVHYINKNAPSLTALRDVQVEHYGREKRGPRDLRVWLDAVRQHAAEGRITPLYIEAPVSKQLGIWP